MILINELFQQQSQKCILIFIDKVMNKKTYRHRDTLCSSLLTALLEIYLKTVVTTEAKAYLTMCWAFF